MKKAIKDITFRIKTHCVVITLAILGVICIIISNVIETSIISNVIYAAGQTLATSVCISLLLEISTIHKETANAIVTAQETVYKSIFWQKQRVYKIYF